MLIIVATYFICYKRRFQKKNLKNDLERQRQLHKQSHEVQKKIKMNGNFFSIIMLSFHRQYFLRSSQSLRKLKKISEAEQ